METFSAALALCEGNRPINGGFPSQKVILSFRVFYVGLITVLKNIRVVGDFRRHDVHECDITETIHYHLQTWSMLSCATTSHQSDVPWWRHVGRTCYVSQVVWSRLRRPHGFHLSHRQVTSWCKIPLILTDMLSVNKGVNKFSVYVCSNIQWDELSQDILSPLCHEVHDPYIWISFSILDHCMMSTFST